MVIVRIIAVESTALLTVNVATALGLGLPKPSNPMGLVDAVIMTLLESVFAYMSWLAGSITLPVEAVLQSAMLLLR